MLDLAGLKCAGPCSLQSLRMPRGDLGGTDRSRPFCSQQALEKHSDKEAMSVEQVIDSLDVHSNLSKLLFDFLIAVGFMTTPKTPNEAFEGS